MDARADGLIPKPVACWTFDTGTEADLSSALPGQNTGFAFVSSGNEKDAAEITFRKGYVSLNSSAELLASDINGGSFPGLRDAVTIFVTMRYDSDAFETVFNWGLVNQVGDDTKPWEGMTFCHAVNEKGLLYAYLYGGDHWHATKESVPGTEWFTVALCFNNGVITHYFNGLLSSEPSTSDVQSLNDFKGLALGRVFKGETSLPVSFANVRIYDSALTAAQIEKLSAESLAAVRNLK